MIRGRGAPTGGGRIYVMPRGHCAHLARMLGSTVDAVADVRVVEHSRFARWHRAVATTRRGAIYLRGSGAAFAGDATLMLHEYFHVLRQWDAGTLTVARYVAESLRRGYVQNRFEIEARAFADAHAARLLHLLRGASGATAQATQPQAVADCSFVSRP